MHEYIHIYITNAITNNDHLMRDAYWMLNIFQNLFSAFGNFKSFGSLCNTMEVQKWNFLIMTTKKFYYYNERDVDVWFSDLLVETNQWNMTNTYRRLNLWNLQIKY